MRPRQRPRNHQPRQRRPAIFNIERDISPTLGIGGTIDVGGSITNAGHLNVGGDERLRVTAGGLTLTGAGQVLLFGDAVASAQGVATLTNVDNTITAHATLGFDGIDLVNEAAGVIQNHIGELVLGSANGTIINTGVIESDGRRIDLHNVTVDDASGGELESAVSIVNSTVRESLAFPRQGTRNSILPISTS